MCYSAQIEADFRQYVKLYGADIDIEEFVRLFWSRKESSKAKIPKAMEAAFSDPRTEEERQIGGLIQGFEAEQVTKLEQDLFKQRARLADAERSLATKATKKAADEQRIATGKIKQITGWLSDLHRTDLKDRDSRIYPGWYAPLLIVKDGKRTVIPMRYQCRLPGWTEAMERQKPGTYNARLDNLGKAWRKLFGYHHGIMIVKRFYENVDRDGKNVVLEFNPEPAQDMLVACLWSRWTAPGEPDLLSFAAITDEPPAEVLAAGHDRCIVPIQPENIDAWLNPDPADLAAQYAILDDRPRPYYDHRMAA